MRSYEERECNNNVHNVNESAANVSQVWYHKKPTDSDERANKKKRQNPQCRSGCHKLAKWTENTYSHVVYDLSLVVHFWLKSVMDLDYEIKLFVHLDRCAPIDASLRWNCIELRHELKRKKPPYWHSECISDGFHEPYLTCIILSKRNCSHNRQQIRKVYTVIKSC